MPERQSEFNVKPVFQSVLEMRAEIEARRKKGESATLEVDSFDDPIELDSIDSSKDDSFLDEAFYKDLEAFLSKNK